MIVNNDALWLAIVGVLVLATYVYHLVRSALRTAADRSWIAARGTFVATLLVIGVTRIAVGSFVRAFPTVEWLGTVQDLIAPVLTLLLLSGGIVLGILWTLEDRDRAR